VLRQLTLVFVALVWAAASSAAVSGSDDRRLYTQDELAAIFHHSPMPSVPSDTTDRVADNPRAARLGEYLFFDKRLSKNGEVACATCHQPARAFTDGRAIAKTLALGTRHTPTILGAAYNQWYFWDGHTDSQWSQALQPFENPREMGTTRTQVLHEIASDTRLHEAYREVFGALPKLDGTDRVGIDRAYSNVGKSIEAYERKLTVGTSPFDRYVAALRAHDAAGEQVISPAAKRGLKLFVGAGNCELCHSGPDFTDGQFHNLGLPLLAGEKPDAGRADGIRLVRADPFNGTGRFSDDRTGTAKERLEFLPSPASQVGAFKTPSLRNVARIPPYMHDGRFKNLGQVLAFYAKGAAGSRGRLVGKREATANLVPHLTAQQQADLIAFLRTLSDAPLPRALAQAPTAP
jgi:cytochrome c peroxidase